MSDSEEQEFIGDLEEGEVDHNGNNDNDDDEDDVPLTSLKRPPPERNSSSKRASKPVNYREDDDDEDDDEDDIPLAALRKTPASSKPAEVKNGKKKASATAAKSSKAKATPTKKASKTKANIKSPSKKNPTSPSKTKANGSAAAAMVSSSSATNSKSYEWASAALYGTQCEKGLLIQRLLCRWWYAMEWPDPSVASGQAPPNYDALAGFPGVFVCTSGDKVGHLLDQRNLDSCPSFKHFAQKSSEELQSLLLKALQEQKRQLIEADGPGTPNERVTNDMIKWATKVNTTKADRDAEKVLKTHSMSLS